MLVVISGNDAIPRLRGMNVNCIVSTSDLTSTNLMYWVAERLLKGKDVGVTCSSLDNVEDLLKLAVECGSGFLTIQSVDPNLN